MTISRVRIACYGILMVLLSFCSLSSRAQFPEKEPYSFSLKFHYGFVMRHSKNMAHLANQRPWALEADVSRQTVGNKKWQAVHNFPVIGYSFHYFHMDRKKPLGDSYSLIVYYSQKFLKSRRSFFSYRVGLGPGYIEKRFDLHQNYKDNLNSTRFNYGLNGRITFFYKIGKHFFFNIGAGLMHFSNGALKVPNLGINLPTVHAGLTYTPSGEDVKLPPRDTSRSYGRGIHFNTMLSGGLKQVYPVHGRSYFASSLSLYADKYVSRRSILNAGMDLMYDGSYKLVLDSEESASFTKYFKAGIIVGHEYVIGKLSLLTQFGIYTYNPLKQESGVYQRIGLKYFITEKLFANINLKTHFGQADFVEWGLGIKL